MKFYKFIQTVGCEDASKVFSKLHGAYRGTHSSMCERNFLFESKDISHIYGRLSLIGIDPVLEIKGKNNKFSIKCLNERGAAYLTQFDDVDFSVCDDFTITACEIFGIVNKSDETLEENQRTKKKNIAEIIRIVIQKFKHGRKELIGLYGAFSYDFIRLFENIPEILPDNGIDDFRFFLYDTFVFFDHLKEKAEITVYRLNKNDAKKTLFKLKTLMHGIEPDFCFKISDAKFNLDRVKYKKMVEHAKNLARGGELFEIVYSNTLKAKFSGDPFALYQKYRDINPSPYLFYFDFGNEQLIGASPEMMVRCENNVVYLRPISGTAKRGDDPIEDHENMLELLKSTKERAELDMLIDLGRNDLARICEPGIKISDYRFVEKYSKVMHTVAHLTGRLKKESTALDALIACLNAGTLTGAPKVAAMIEIEKSENSRRGYYGGSIGYLTFSGEMDTGIIIRTAHIRGNELLFRVGATLLYESDPESEYRETLNKAEAFLTTFEA